ncbi:MAG: hypothetical protein ACT4O1_15655 [Gemmatimonadota bacterium]
MTAYEAPNDVRPAARDHVMKHVMDIDEIVRTVPAGDPAARQAAALAAIEDPLIRDGFIDLVDTEKRRYPASTIRDNERNDA